MLDVERLVYVDGMGTIASLVSLHAWSRKWERAFCRALRNRGCSGGLWVGKYLKTVTYQHMTRGASVEMARHCDEVEANTEGMVVHARTAAVRLERM